MFSKAPIEYIVNPVHPEAHLFEVTLQILKPDPKGQQLRLPTWTPGSYLVRDFSKHVVHISAHTRTGAVSLIKIDLHTWQLPPLAEPVLIRYQVYAWELSVRGAHLDNTHGYFNGARLFLEVLGQSELPCVVQLMRPEGARYESWALATSLPLGPKTARYAFGEYYAENYDDLLDHPVEMGNYEKVSFMVAGVQHDLVVTGYHRGDLVRLTVDLKEICEHQVAFFAEAKPPMDYYVFLLTLTADGYGGLEHRASSSLQAKREDMPIIGVPELSEGYKGLLGLFSHEYFHLWHIKRIKPAVFLPYNLTGPTCTELLWVFEGFTAYYDDLFLVRSHVIDEESYLGFLEKNITRLMRCPGRLNQTLAESSYDAWHKFYQQDENSPNAIVSYYLKGSLLALCLDIALRVHSKDQYSLDTVMHLLWKEYGTQQQGLAEQAIFEIVNKLQLPAVSQLLQTGVYTTQELPLAALLAEVGVHLHFRTSTLLSDLGGKLKGEGFNGNQAVLGVRLNYEDGHVSIAQVFDGGAAQEAGLAPGDVLVAFDGLRVTKENYAILARRVGPQVPVTLTIFRQEVLLQFEVMLKVPPNDTAILQFEKEVSAAVSARRQVWLNTQERL